MNEHKNEAIPAILDELRDIRSLLAQMAAVQMPTHGNASPAQLYTIRQLLTELGYEKGDQADAMAKAGFPVFDVLTDEDAQLAIERLQAAKSKSNGRVTTGS